MAEDAKRHPRKKILFVCTGNTCRSPMAQALLRGEIKKRKVKYYDVASAGIKVGEGASLNEKAERVMAAHGLALKNFKPRQLKKRMAESAYVVICMTDEQKEFVGEADNVYSIREIFGEDIPDPYGYDIHAYEYVFYKLQQAVSCIAEKLFSAKPNQT